MKHKSTRTIWVADGARMVDDGSHHLFSAGWCDFGPTDEYPIKATLTLEYEAPDPAPAPGDKIMWKAANLICTYLTDIPGGDDIIALTHVGTPVRLAPCEWGRP